MGGLRKFLFDDNIKTKKKKEKLKMKIHLCSKNILKKAGKMDTQFAVGGSCRCELEFLVKSLEI